MQKGIEESDMVIFWVTDNFLKSNWCKMEMKAYIGRMIEENIRMFIQPQIYCAGAGNQKEYR